MQHLGNSKFTYLKKFEPQSKTDRIWDKQQQRSGGDFDNVIDDSTQQTSSDYLFDDDFVSGGIMRAREQSRRHFTQKSILKGTAALPNK